MPRKPKIEEWLLIFGGVCLALAAVLFVINALDPVRQLEFPPPPGSDLIRIHWLKTAYKPRAVLIYAPGLNADAGNLLRDPVWRRFTEENQLGLMALHFITADGFSNDGTGYYYPERGSGELLLKAVNECYGRECKLLLFGFSAGAVTIIRLAEQHPERVIGWCGHGAPIADTPAPLPETAPPGIIACGESDGCLDLARRYYLEGEKQNRRWLWITISGLDHRPSGELNAFIRDYFRRLLDNQSPFRMDGGSETASGWLNHPGQYEMIRKLAGASR